MLLLMLMLLTLLMLKLQWEKRVLAMQLQYLP